MNRLLWIVAAMAIAPWVAPAARAQCVGADTSVQANISGNPTTERSNDVEFEVNGPCRGNASSTSGVQLNVGGNGPVRQERRVRQTFNGSDGRGPSGPTVTVKTNVGVDVYNPADNLDRSTGTVRSR